ncbi:MAG: ATP-dependent Clp protease ATP-binding subunit [Clostridiales bacterium]|nr:ATP-dependent Clp protease ATP-binding subunit [Clostridiales bacterium]
MQPVLCSKCRKNVAVVFLTKMDGGETKNEGYCLSCAKGMGIKPLDDLLSKMDISDDDLDNLTNDMMSAFGGPEAMESLMESQQSSDDGEDSDDDEDEEDGKTATFPFLNRLFGSSNPPTPQREEREDNRSRDDGNRSDQKQQKNGGQKRKFLENYCTSLTRQAREGKLDGVIGREQEISRVMQILNRRQKNNPCLIGEPGVGKTAIAEGLALRIASGDVPYKLQDKEVYLLDLTALVAGTQFRGQFESRMKSLIEEIKKIGNIILVIDEIHNIVGAGDAEGSMNAANILKPALSRGEIQVIGATTYNEYRKYIEKDAALERRFQPVNVAEPSIDGSVKILEGIAHFYEDYHQVIIPRPILRQAVTLSERYITDRYLPDKAIDLIDEACSDVNLHNANLARLAAIQKERADLAKEKELILASQEQQSSQRSARLKENEQKQSRCRQQLTAVNNEAISLQSGGGDQSQREERLRLIGQQSEKLREELRTLQEERNNIQTTPEDNRGYERLAYLRSAELKLDEEQRSLESQGRPQLGVENLARVIELWTNIPASRIQEEEFARLSQLDQRLKQHIIGQDEAVDAVTRAIRRNRVGISPKHKPVSFIFVGSTGVGKTELVKQLAQDLFNSPESLIRLDMSEFMEKQAVSRIVGSPPGYVGYDEAGQLTEKIRRKPYSVILFDEIEKAHPDVLNILLQILDDGQITDSHGRKVNFENTVIVMTSNAGSESKNGSVGFGRTADEQDKEKTMKALQSFLRPEFINRVDEIVHFNHLSEENFKGITGIMLGELRDSLEEKGITFTWDDALVDYLTRKSYSLTYGARNLRRLIQKELEDVIAQRLIQNYDQQITLLQATAEDDQIMLISG